jgi:hypothetical protein
VKLWHIEDPSVACEWQEVVGTHGYKENSVTTDDLVIFISIREGCEVGKLHTTVQKEFLTEHLGYTMGCV